MNIDRQIRQWAQMILKESEEKILEESSEYFAEPDKIKWNEQDFTETENDYIRKQITDPKSEEYSNVAMQKYKSYLEKYFNVRHFIVISHADDVILFGPYTKERCNEIHNNIAEKVPNDVTAKILVLDYSDAKGEEYVPRVRGLRGGHDADFEENNPWF